MFSFLHKYSNFDKVEALKVLRAKVMPELNSLA